MVAGISVPVLLLAKPYFLSKEAESHGHHDDEEAPDGLLSSKLALLLHEPAPIAAARKKATHYDIRATGGRKVGKLCLFKTAYKLGEDILGMFNFTDVDLSCLQYSVSLMGEEKIPTPQEHVDNVKKSSAFFLD